MYMHVYVYVYVYVYKYTHYYAAANTDALIAGSRNGRYPVTVQSALAACRRARSYSPKAKAGRRLKYKTDTYRNKYDDEGGDRS
jgi:hypothetical protein